MSKSSKQQNIYVGMFISIALFIFVAGILLIGNINETFSSKMEVYSVFDDVRGLKAGDNVWFSGVKIGTVNTLTFKEHSKVEVSMKIEKNSSQFIRDDSKIKLGSDGLIGNKILIIYGGSETANFLSVGDTLVSVRTISSEEVMNMLQKNNTNILAITTDLRILLENLADGVGSIGKLLTYDSLYANIQSISNSLNTAALKANKSMDAFVAFSNGLNKEGTLLNEISKDTTLYTTLKTTLLQLKTIADSTGIMVSNLKQAAISKTSTAGKLLYDEEMANQLQEMINNMESSSQKLDEDLEALQHSIFLRRYFKKKEK